MKSPFERTPQKSQKEIYLEQYEASKKHGEPFFPNTVAKDAIVALVVVAVVFALSAILPASMESPADPTSITYNPRPEWYFMFFFQFLKLFPGYLEPVAAAVIPLLAVLVLVLLPFLDRNPERRWSKRKAFVRVSIFGLAIFATLEVTGIMSAPVSPAGEEPHAVQAGRSTYREVNCAYCHSINGVGGTVGPDLGTVAAKLSKDQMSQYLQNPHAMIPATLHPKLQFTKEELDSLVAYLATLGAQVSYTPQAVELYNQQCSACHMIGGKGGTVGPDLSRVGSIRNMAFLEAFISDPSSVLPGATMPGFKRTLSPDQIKDIAAYLSSLKGTGTATKP